MSYFDELHADRLERELASITDDLNTANMTINAQRQTIDALTAALESLVDWADGYSSLPDNYIRHNARSVLDALEKARGEKSE